MKLSKSLISQLKNEKWKCPHHNQSYSHFLHLCANSKRHRICSECKSENKIPDNEILHIHQILESDENTFFSTYPVLEDYQTLEDLKKLQSQYKGILSQKKQASAKSASNIDS